VKGPLVQGADVNAANGVGATALMWAVPDLEKVKLLVAHGAHVNARSTNLGRTAEALQLYRDALSIVNAINADKATTVTRKTATEIEVAISQLTSR